MTKNKWDKFKKNFSKNFIDFLMIFAAEQDFINKHRRKSSVIKEQDRYGSDQRKILKNSIKNSIKEGLAKR